jgi:hypothetical protein
MLNALAEDVFLLEANPTVVWIARSRPALKATNAKTSMVANSAIQATALATADQKTQAK